MAVRVGSCATRSLYLTKRSARQVNDLQTCRGRSRYLVLEMPIRHPGVGGVADDSSGEFGYNGACGFEHVGEF